MSLSSAVHWARAIHCRFGEKVFSSMFFCFGVKVKLAAFLRAPVEVEVLIRPFSRFVPLRKGLSLPMDTQPLKLRNERDSRIVL